MKSIKWIIFLIIFFNTVQSYCQDTISIYFESGSSKIQRAQVNVLNNIPIQFDLSELDSVHFIGMADSVGNFKSNLKLSEKRAMEVARYCERLFPPNHSTKIISLGEKTLKEENINRRVDIVLYFFQGKPDTTEQNEITDSVNGCYYIDYELLHRCNIRPVMKGRKEYIIIETSPLYLKKTKEHYTATQTKNGEVVTRKLRWTLKNTGNLWWSKARYVVTMAKSDFDKFKIFKIEKLPCSECNEDFKTKSKISKADTCMQVDRFLMENIQFKTTLFNNHSVKIRAPREYINANDKYYIDCDFKNELEWMTLKGRKKKNYYYSELPRYFNSISNITRVMSCCKSNPEPSECDIPIIKCATLGEPDRSFLLYVEIGDQYQQSRNAPYAGICISKSTVFSQVTMLAGTDIDLNFYGALRYQFNFLSFPFSVLNPASSWQSPTDKNIIEKYGRLYLGAEFKTTLSKDKPNLFEQNIHIGIAAINTKVNAFIPKIFFQYGVGFDYSGNYNSKVYSILQLGIQMRILRLGKK